MNPKRKIVRPTAPKKSSRPRPAHAFSRGKTAKKVSA
jgi:hypothetical protein